MTKKVKTSNKTSSTKWVSGNKAAEKVLKKANTNSIPSVKSVAQKLKDAGVVPAGKTWAMKIKEAGSKEARKEILAERAKVLGVGKKAGNRQKALKKKVSSGSATAEQKAHYERIKARRKGTKKAK